MKNNCRIGPRGCLTKHDISPVAQLLFYSLTILPAKAALIHFYDYCFIYPQTSVSAAIVT